MMASCVLEIIVWNASIGSTHRPETGTGALLPAIPNDVQCFLKYVFVILRGARQIHFCATLSQPIVNRGTEDRVAAFLRHIHPVDQLFIIWFSRLVIPRL